MERQTAGERQTPGRYGRYEARDPMVVRSVRALSGAVAAGTVVLACVAVGAAFVGTREGFPGPGSTTVAAHVVAAVVAVAAQWWTDRRFGAQALLGSLVVFVSLGTLVWTQWWG